VTEKAKKPQPQRCGFFNFLKAFLNYSTFSIAIPTASTFGRNTLSN
jgi:hypothetical protein